MCLGQDRYWRRYWCLPTCGSIFVEGMESAQPEEFSDSDEEKEAIKDAQEEKIESSKKCKSKKKEKNSEEESDEEKTKTPDVKESRRRPGKRKGRGSYRQGKKSKVEQNSCSATNSENDLSENDEASENCDNRKKCETVLESNNSNEKSKDLSDKPVENHESEVDSCKNVNKVRNIFLKSKLPPVARCKYFFLFAEY